MSSEIEVVEDEVQTHDRESASANSANNNGEANGIGEESLRNDVYTAAAYGDLEKLQRLVECEGCSVSETDGLGYYALQWAALNNRTAPDCSVPLSLSPGLFTPDVPSSIGLAMALITGDDFLINMALKGMQMLSGSISITHVEDVCRAHTFLAEKESASGRYICCAANTGDPGAEAAKPAIGGDININDHHKKRKQIIQTQQTKSTKAEMDSVKSFKGYGKVDELSLQVAIHAAATLPGLPAKIGRNIANNNHLEKVLDVCEGLFEDVVDRLND